MISNRINEVREDLCKKGIEARAIKCLLGEDCAKRQKGSQLSLPRLKAANGVRSFSADGKISHHEFRPIVRDARVTWRLEETKRRPEASFLHPLIQMEHVYEAIQDVTDHYASIRMLNSMRVYIMESVRIYGNTKNTN